MKARYAHVNLVAKDWRKLAQFYEQVLGCIPLQPERDYRGAHLEAATALPGAILQGMHLRLPGYDEGGPTLEIFEYYPGGTSQEPQINRPGFAHIAFEVEDVKTARDEFLAAGGSAYGELTVFETSGGEQVEMVYLRDPEGNIVELQRWET